MIDYGEIDNKQKFEEFVISVLRQMIITKQQKLLTILDSVQNNYEENKKQETSANEKLGFSFLRKYDAYAPDGVGEIKGPLVIQIVHNPRAMSFRSVSLDVKILYIVKTKIKNSKKAPILKPNENVIIWWGEDIASWKIEYPIDYYRYFVEDKPENNFIKFEQKVESNKSQLKQFFAENRVSLSLGAGVSMEYDIPNWEKLIEGFYEELVNAQKIVKVDLVKKKIGNSSIISGQFVVENINDFGKKLHKQFYEDKKPPSNDDQTTLAFIAKIIIKLSDNRRFNVVTYNYDDNLEILLNYVNHKFNVVYNDKNYVSEALTIYHVHGYFPRGSDKENVEDIEYFEKSLVFSETAYYKVYNDPYYWSNILQQNIYRENIFLFVGCSLSDPYLRRILETSKVKNRPHFCFMLKDNLDLIDQLTVHNHFARVGVECIWFENLDEYKKELELLL